MIDDGNTQPITERRLGINGAIAAALTRSVGSMTTLYVVLVFFVAWMGLATWWTPLHRVDPYPFPFLLFLDNVVQLVLCLVILVGQRVLAVAADQREVRTYQDAEAIFHEVADLQAQLDRHDQALSRGVSLLESSPHPWIERHRVQSPVQVRSDEVRANHRVAAWLTVRLGSVWGFYVAAAGQAGWIILAETGVERFDRYPFAFMSFLSTLAQLLFMIVIMVGQDVLGRTSERRSEQTFHDAEAILYECRRIKARLAAQERVIDTLAGYASTHVTEQLARAIHSDSALSAHEAHASGETNSALRQSDWETLPDETRDSYRARARRIGEDLAAIGYFTVPALKPAPAVRFAHSDVLTLARLDYERRRRERSAYDLDGTNWYQLPQQDRAVAIAAAEQIPKILKLAGFRVLRDTTADDHPTEADFSPEQWQTLRQALTASALLAALEQGAVGTEDMIELSKTVSDVSVTHPARFLRELAAASTFGPAPNPETEPGDHEASALQVIQDATEIVAVEAPAKLGEFRALLEQIAAAVSRINPARDRSITGSETPGDGLAIVTAAR